jgi:hypothetical protein
MALALGGALALGAPAMASSAPPTVTVGGVTWVAVSNAAELLYVDANQTEYLAANIALEGSIDLGGATWTPIGASSTPFTGVFDGQKFTVSDYTVASGEPNIGFFGGESGTIENLTLTGTLAPTSTTTTAGLLVGEVTAGTISDATATGAVSAVAASYVGGLVGELTGATIEDSSASGSVTGGSASAGIGGLVGEATAATIEDSTAIGDVTAEGGGATVGGLLGTASYAVTLDGDSAYGTVTATGGGTSVGGLVGNLGYPASTIEDSFAAGDVTGANNSPIGGLIGALYGTVEDSYATGDVASTLYGASGVGGLIGWLVVGGSASNVYATGNVSGIPSDQIGGLVGSALGGSVEEAYAIGSVGQAAGLTSGGVVGGVDDLSTFENDLFRTAGSLPGDGYGEAIGGASAAAMTNAATYAAWPDFSSTWGLSRAINGGYPYLLAVQPPATALPVPSLQAESVTVNGASSEVVGNLGSNSAADIASGQTVGFIEERAALAAGASLTGEGAASSYLSDILSGNGVGHQTYVSGIEQGQFAALYQKLDIIPVWTANTVSLAGGLSALIHTDAPTLAIENYLVELDGFGWPAAMAEAAAGFPLQNG